MSLTDTKICLIWWVIFPWKLNLHFMFHKLCTLHEQQQSSYTKKSNEFLLSLCKNSILFHFHFYVFWLHAFPFIVATLWWLSLFTVYSVLYSGCKKEKKMNKKELMLNSVRESIKGAKFALRVFKKMTLHFFYITFYVFLSSIIM